MMSPWERADKVMAQAIAAAAIHHQADIAPMAHAFELIGELAKLTRDHIERTGLREEVLETVAPLVEGQEYELTIKVKARVMEVEGSQGQSYELWLETRDFMSGRRICIDHDEIAAASFDQRKARQYG